MQMWHVAGFAGFFATVIAVVVGWLMHAFPEWKSSDWAAWAQAITSGAAVLTALFVVIWQHHLQLQREQSAAKAAKNERLRTARELLDLCIASVRDVMSTGPDRPADVPKLSDMLMLIVGVTRVLSDLRLTDMSLLREAQPLLQATSLLTRMQLTTNHFAMFGGDGGLPGQVYRTLEPLLADLEKATASLALAS